MLKKGVFFLIFSLISASSFGASWFELKEAIIARKERVAVFNEIQRLADENHLRVFLFGGSAASFAYYVNTDLKREAGDAEILNSRFQYYWDQIYRTSQDLDLAIQRKDGIETEGDIKNFLNLVQQKFQNLRIDVLGINTTSNIENKFRPSILGAESEFLKQNTDSVSTGLIELTHENLIQDLRLSEDGAPLFLKDLSEGRLQFFRSPLHKESKRYLAEMNPEILSVIRFLTNLLRYDLEPDVSFEKEVRQILKDSPEYLNQKYVLNWIGRNAPKIFSQAANLERAYNLVSHYHVGAYLQKISEGYKLNTVLWWLKRKPLPSGRTLKPLLLNASVRDKEKKAKELGLDIVTHETTSFTSYEQIVSSPRGIPNFLLSDPVNGKAAFGQAVYMTPGHYGRSRDDKGLIQIRMKISPDAVAGQDFNIVERAGEKMILVYNRDILRLIDRDLDTHLTSIFNLVVQSLSNIKNKFDIHLIAERLKNKKFTREEKDQLIKLVEERIYLGDIASPLLFSTYFEDAEIQALGLKIVEALESKNIKFSGGALFNRPWAEILYVYDQLIHISAFFTAIGLMIALPRYLLPEEKLDLSPMVSAIMMVFFFSGGSKKIGSFLLKMRNSFYLRFQDKIDFPHSKANLKARSLIPFSRSNNPKHRIESKNMINEIYRYKIVLLLKVERLSSYRPDMELPPSYNLHTHRWDVNSISADNSWPNMSGCERALSKLKKIKI